MAHVNKQITRNFIASKRACSCCGNNYNAWRVEINEKDSQVPASSKSYFWCYVCDLES